MCKKTASFINIPSRLLNIAQIGRFYFSILFFCPGLVILVNAASAAAIPASILAVSASIVINLWKVKFI